MLLRGTGAVLLLVDRGDFSVPAFFGLQISLVRTPHASLDRAQARRVRLYLEIVNLLPSSTEAPWRTRRPHLRDGNIELTRHKIRLCDLNIPVLIGTL